MISQATLLGFRLRDEGIAKLERHAWLARARTEAQLHCWAWDTVTSDDVHRLMPEPPHPNCWGALFKDKRFRSTGTHIQSKRKEAHARWVQIWELA